MDKGKIFRDLHASTFVMPNPWDPGTTKLLGSFGFRALATTSAGFAFSRGLPDGAVTFEQMIHHCREVTAATDLPVSADLEKGKGDSAERAAETIFAAEAAGLAGCSIEDHTGDPDRPIYDFSHAVERVAAAVKTARALKRDFVFTAQAENFLWDKPDLDNTIKRLQAFEKAGAFIRLKSRTDSAIRVYTPHGGSLHYPRTSRKGAIYSRLERALMNNTDLFLFESAFARDTYQRTIGTPKGLVRCVFNGVTAAEFDPVPRAADATDVVYVGEFRHIKGADLLVDAVARLRADGKPVTLTLAGDGEETAALKAQVARLSLANSVQFIGHVKARHGFSKGKLLVVPSRGDSMPYVVIEAGAAGIPMVAANVGGIPEIFGPFTDALFAPSNIGSAADAIKTAMAEPEAAQARAGEMRERILQHFSQKAMVDGVLAGYRDAFEAARR